VFLFLFVAVACFVPCLGFRVESSGTRAAGPEAAEAEAEETEAGGAEAEGAEAEGAEAERAKSERADEGAKAEGAEAAGADGNCRWCAVTFKAVSCSGIVCHRARWIVSRSFLPDLR
jgi:hypothetical protein